MNTIRMLGTVLLTVLLIVGFTACGDDDKGSSTLQFTKETIVGSWETSGISVTRGESYIVRNGVVITFNNDNSCKGFHSMENAYRINQGKIETYYSKSNEPMFVYTLLSTNGNSMKVQIDGTLDDDFSCTITLSKGK